MPGRQAGLGLGQDARQRLAGVAPPALEQRARDRPGVPAPPSIERRACPRHRSARDSGRTGCRVAGACGRPTDDPVAGLDRRVARQRGGQPEAGAGRRPTVRSVATWWPSRGEPTVSTTIVHGPLPVGEPASDGPSGPSRRGARSTAMPTASARTRDPPATRQPQSRASSSRPAATTMRGQERRSSAPAARAAIAAPTASQPVRGTSAHRDELAQLLERLLAEDASRAQLLDGRERRLLARRDDLLRGRRPDAGQRLELGLRGGVQVDRPTGRAVAAGRAARAGGAPLAPAGASSRDGTRTWSPSLSVAARLSSRSALAVSTRGPYPPAAATRSPTRDPAGSRKTPGRGTAPTISTTTSPAAGRPADSARLEAGAGRAGHRQCRTAVDGDRLARTRPRTPGRKPAPHSRRRPGRRDDLEDRGRQHERCAVVRPPAQPSPAARQRPAGASSTRHGGVALGSTIGTPRRAVVDGDDRDTATSRHVGGHFPTRRDVVSDLTQGRLAATYLQCPSARSNVRPSPPTDQTWLPHRGGPPCPSPA